jgi:hypothetical protein
MMTAPSTDYITVGSASLACMRSLRLSEQFGF